MRILIIEDDARAADTLAQGLRELIDDPTRRRALGAAARQSVLERYDEGTMAEETLALYHRLLDPAAAQVADEVAEPIRIAG